MNLRDLDKAALLRDLDEAARETGRPIIVRFRQEASAAEGADPAPARPQSFTVPGFVDTDDAQREAAPDSGQRVATPHAASAPGESPAEAELPEWLQLSAGLSERTRLDRPAPTELLAEHKARAESRRRRAARQAETQTLGAGAAASLMLAGVAAFWFLSFDGAPVGATAISPTLWGQSSVSNQMTAYARQLEAQRAARRAAERQLSTEPRPQQAAEADRATERPTADPDPAQPSRRKATPARSPRRKASSASRDRANTRPAPAPRSAPAPRRAPAAAPRSAPAPAPRRAPAPAPAPRRAPAPAPKAQPKPQPKIQPERPQPSSGGEPSLGSGPSL